MSRNQNGPEPHRATGATVVEASRTANPASERERRAKVSAVDVDRIVDTVHRRFLRQLAIERERRGVR